MDKGQRILLDYFWSNGWQQQPTISEQDFAIAKAEGYMFEPAEQEISHAETLERICAAVRKIEPADAANAFLYSLSTRKLEYRSALGSYWYAAAIERHEKRSAVLESSCEICAWHRRIDRNVMNFMRYKFGGYNHTNADFALFDLERFVEMPKVAPTPRDTEIFKRILGCVEQLDDTDKVGKLRDRILQERILPTNKTETCILLGILGICGVLASQEYPCFYDRFADTYARGSVEHKNDFYYPVHRWRKRDGICADWLKRAFPMIDFL